MQPDEPGPAAAQAVAQPAEPGLERLLVCISPGAEAISLVQAGQKLATTFEAEWRALYIETPKHEALSPEDREEAFRALRLATDLGALAHKRTGFKVLDEIIGFAQEHHISKIVVGRPRPRPWWRPWQPSLVDHLLRLLAGKIDIFVVHTDETPPAAGLGARRHKPFLPLPIRPYAWAVTGVGLCSMLAGLLAPYLTLTNLGMLYLLAVVIMAPLVGQGPAILASFLSVAAFAFFFVPETWSFAIAGADSILTLTVMLLISVIISRLTAKVRYQSQAARQQERQAAALYEMNQYLTALHSLDELLEVAVAQIGKIFKGRATILMPVGEALLAVRAGGPLSPEDEKEWAVARWVYRYGHTAGWGTETLNEVKGLYLPLRTPQAVIGVLRLETAQSGEGLGYDRLRLLEALGGQVALAIERESLGQQAERARFEVEAERLRNILLSSVSHDLRTPLTVIAGSASALLEGEAGLDTATKRELAQSIFEEAKRLDRLVHNLLEMSRLQSGEVAINKDWQVLEEVLGCALAQLETQLKDRPVHIHLPPDLPLVRMDAVLMERVLVNLLENAVKYTPPQSPVEIFAKLEEAGLRLEVADRGPGLPPGEEEKIFEKFYQPKPGGGRGGGLGLAICRSIVDAHGGKISAAKRDGGGAVFSLILPLSETMALDQSLVESQETQLHETTYPVD